MAKQETEMLKGILEGAAFTAFTNQSTHECEIVSWLREKGFEDLDGKAPEDFADTFISHCTEETWCQRQVRRVNTAIEETVRRYCQPDLTWQVMGKRSYMPTSCDRLS